MKYRIRRALTAVALLTSTLVAGVVAAPGAWATVYPEQQWWTTFNGLGLSKVDMRVDTGGTYWKSFAIAHPQQYSTCDAGTNLANQADDKSDLGGTVQTAYRTGTSGNFCLEVNEGWGDDTSTTNLDFYTTVTLKIRDAATGTILPGSYTMTNPGSFHQQQSASINVQMDTSPFNSTADPPLTPGTYQMVVELKTQNYCTPTACSTLGGGFTYHAGQGYFTVTPAYQYLFGASGMGSTGALKLTDLGDQQGATTGINKNYSLVRWFESSWSTPSSQVRTLAGQGKAVVWSVVPPGFTKHTTTTGGAWSNLSQSPWAAAAADVIGTNGLNAQVRALQDDANQTNGPSFMTWTITHEPHDNTSDTAKGWNGGAASAKCGDPVTNLDVKHGVPGNSAAPSAGNDACFGTVAEFAALYNAMKTARDTQCDINGGITGTGYACNKVKIAYIGVPDNMTVGTTVGSGDLMNPSAFWSYIDVIGGDPYNYGCFRKNASNGDGVLNTTPAPGECSTANGWDSFQKTVDNPSAGTDTNGHHKTLMGLAELKDKPVIVAEVASHPGCDGSTETAHGCNKTFTSMDRGTWFSDMYTEMTTNPLILRYMIGFAYFHVGPTSSTYDWRFIPTSNNLSPDTRGLTTYKNTFGSDANFLTTAHSYVFNPTP
ncbi:MAG: hypothetical protein LC750_09230 [Actinobacteria bacterium]|nr:hypothetical protein [Actinomycetota bacterium]